MSHSLNEQIAENYFHTTAERSHVASSEYYERASDGLLLRLDSWLPKNPDADCLDLASGCGEMLYLLERQGFRNTTGVDLCQEELEQAKPFIKGRLNCADVVDFLRQREAQSLDFVTALNFLEHLSKDKLLVVLKEVRRVLRPNGTLVAMVPNAISPFGSVTRHWDITHEWAFTPNNFRQLAVLTGFEPDIEFRECGPVAHGIVSALRYLLWQVIRLAIATWFLIEVADTKGGIYTMDMLVRLRIAND